MRPSTHTSQGWVCQIGLAAALALSSTCEALAGGFEVQQSAYFQGMSFAGVATGGPSLASISWNPATSSFAGPGLTMESSYAAVLPEAELRVLNPDMQLPPPGTANVDMGRDGFLAASFNALRVSDRTVLGLSITAPFGLVTKPDDLNWAGKYEALTSKIFSLNATPSLSYEIAPGLSLGVGVQFQYFDLLELRAATPLGGSNINGDDFGVGVMAGINYSPTKGTSIGLGFRSSIEHDLQGDFKLHYNAAVAPLVGVERVSVPVNANIDLPEKLTFSFRQSVSPRARLLGTVDWANWSRLGVIPIRLEGPFPPLKAGDPIASLVFNWRDGWLFALGGEYDCSPRLTLRAGVAYEVSPVDGATTRLVQVPDSNHTWASVGATYRVSDNSSIDFAYSHGFFEDDAPFERLPAATLLQTVPPLIGEANVSADMISVGWRWRWGGHASAPAPLK
ncbi:MAG: outer membrane protein transport protein [Methyloceanibacter sp.]